ncbi:MAG TPA: YceI family protein [Polyangiaceae bacterium]
MKRPVLALVSLSIIAFAFVAAAKLEVIGKSEVRFQAVGPAGLKINGSAPSLTSKEDGESLVLTAPADRLETGIGLRDRHLKKYINAEKHREITFKVKKSSLKVPDDGKEVSSKAKGSLTLNGQTKPTSFAYKAKRTGSDIHVQGLGDLDIRNFGIEVPCYLGVCVDPIVKLKVGFKLRDK